MNNKLINSGFALGGIFYLDLIKCIGIICVIYGHVELFGLSGSVATVFMLICTTVCLVVISILSKSAILCRYVLGKR